METLGKRLRDLREELARKEGVRSVSRAEIARRIKPHLPAKGQTSLTPEALRQYEEDLATPRANVRKALAAVYKTTEEFLEFGTVAPKVDDVLLRQLFNFYAALNDDNRHTLVGVANRLYNEQNPGRSVANSYPGPLIPPPSPLLQGMSGKPLRADISLRKGRAK